MANRARKLIAELFTYTLLMLKPPKLQTVSEWADNNRILVSESSSRPGRWRTDTAPYQKEIMDSFTQAGVWQIVIMAGALMIGASYSMGGVGLSTICREVYGPEKFASHYAYIAMAANIGSAVSIALIGYVYDGAGAYLPALIGLVVLAVCGFVLLEYIGRASAAQQR